MEGGRQGHVRARQHEQLPAVMCKQQKLTGKSMKERRGREEERRRGREEERRGEEEERR